MRHTIRRVAKAAALGLAGLAVAIQFVPYGWEHPQPPVSREPAWSSVAARELAVRACFDCHSNQVNWPWYSYVAPVSWIVRRHVEDGRRQLNFSTWDKPQREAREATEEVQKKKMPPNYYLPLHAEARLSDAERQVLMNELRTIARTAIR